LSVTSRTKPVRIFEADDSSLGLVAGLLKRSRADIFHAAWREYLATHREELATLFRQTQEALASGDLDRLVQISTPAMDEQIDALVAGLPT
jgi:hypothetical protein